MFKMKQKTIALLYILLTLSFHNALAVIEPKPLLTDKRLKVMVYNPNEVFKFKGFVGYQSNITLSEDEAVENITMGDTSGWQILPSGNRIFLKPNDVNASTNMTMITNKRIYYFVLDSAEAKNIEDPEIPFSVTFLYPNENIQSDVHSFNDLNIDDKYNENYNYNYSISGPDNISPVKIFDDGEFTYFQFSDDNTEIPAFFAVDRDNNESVVNYKISGKYLVVEMVSPRMTLRLGKDVVCVYNDKLYKLDSRIRR
jgi:type IV secretion system protein VirB9